jgi:hypothetical protein
MKNRTKIILGLTAVGAISAVLLLSRKQKAKKKKMKMLDDIADEGYETAGDILYPLKTRKYKAVSVRG